jgi:hypothetical protein
MSETVPPIPQEVLYYNSSSQIAGNTALTLDTRYNGTRLDTGNLLVGNRSLLGGDVGIRTATPRGALEVTGNTIITSKGSSSQNTNEFGLNGNYDSLSLVSPVGLGLNGTTSIFFGLNSLIYYPVARIVGADNGNYSGSLAFQIGNGQQLYQQMRLTMDGIISGNAAFLYKKQLLDQTIYNIALDFSSIANSTSIIDVYVTFQETTASIVHMVKFTLFLGVDIFITDISIQSSGAAPIISIKSMKVIGSKILVGYSAGISYNATVNYMIYGPAAVLFPSIVLMTNDVGVVSVPGKPSNLSVTILSDTSILLNWDSVSSGGSVITGYSIKETSLTKSVDNSGNLISDAIYLITSTAVITDTQITIIGLTRGVTYAFTIKAKNSVGYSEESLPISATPAVVPVAPTNVAATGGNAIANITWTSSSDNGGSPIISYRITSIPGNNKLTVGNVTSAIFAGLTNGTTYVFTVSAINSIGSSVESASSNSVTPLSAPSPPTITSVTPGVGSITIEWSEPDNGGTAITGYIVGDAIGNSASSSVTIDGSGNISSSLVADPTNTEVITNASLISSRKITITGLTPGLLYSFRVSARNIVGTSDDSTPSSETSTLGVPGAPTITSAVAGARSAIITWTAPSSNGGSPITLYTITSTPDNITATSSTVTPTTVSGLSNNTSYTFVIKATNSAGDSLDSDPSSSITTFDLPGVPTGLSATSSAGTITLTWVAPTNTGGTPITGYNIYDTSGNIYNSSTNAFVSDTGSITTIGNILTINITGLTEGSTYTFSIKAVNLAGLSSSVSFTSITLGLPTAPLNFSGVSGNTQIIFSWQAPASTGGSPITGYQIADSSGTIVYDGTANTGITRTITGLQNGTSYIYKIAALNSRGASAYSAPITVIAGLPTTPTGFSTVAGDKSVTLSWSASSGNGSSIVGYRVFLSNGILYEANGTTVFTPAGPLYDSSGALVLDSSSVYTTTSALTITLSSNFNNGVQYTFSVYGANTYGQSSLPAFVSVTPGLPDTPTNLTASTGNGLVSLSWTAPSSGPTPSSYLISYPSTTVTSNSTNAVINNLTNGSPYTFKVNSVNTNGNSVNYVSISATPFTTPGVPVNILLSSTDTTGTISWQAPISDGGSSILGYKIYDSSGSIYDTSGNVVADTGSIYTTNPSTFTYTISGLTVNQTYTFNLKASNAAGNSLGSVLTIKTGVPGTPINLTAIPGDTSVVLTWTAPTTGTPTGYRIEYSGTSETTASNILTKTLTGLVNTRQYTFSVFATTSNGDSLVPAIINATPGLPYAPTGLNGYVGTGSVTLSWTAPSVTGGSAITGYQVGYTIGSGTSVTDIPNITTTTASISGLTSGTSYTFTIKTKNANGNSLSSASITLIPA